MLKSNNATPVSNADVIKPYINALDITKHSRNMWIIDFTNMTLVDAQNYEKPFEYVLEHVKPHRDTVRRQARRERLWQFGETRASASEEGTYIFRSTPTSPCVPSEPTLG